MHWEPAADLVALSGSLFFSRNRRLAEDFERYATTRRPAIPGSEQLNVGTGSNPRAAPSLPVLAG